MSNSSSLPNGVVLGPLQFKRSNTPDAIPSLEELSEGEVAINLADEAVYSRHSPGGSTPDKVVKVGGNYDPVLLAHFNADNPHDVTKQTIGLGNVPNVDPRPLYYVNPDSFTLDVSRVLTEIEYWGAADVMYHIDNSKYSLGDKIDIARISGLAGKVTVCIAGGDFIVDGQRSTANIDLQGTYAIKIMMHKAGTDLWTVMALGS